MIGVFDSGYGGLTIFKEILQVLPQYDYLYLGDNARAPYGPRSFDTIYEYTLEAVQHLFDAGCPLVILACNTASAKALRTIQQKDLPKMDDPSRRVLGVVRPTTERIGEWTKSKKIGIFATQGTVRSESYPKEIHRFFPEIDVYQQACPLWVPLIENGEHEGDGADFFVKKYVQSLLGQCADLDTIVLGCTHYPLLLPKIRAEIPANIRILQQGTIIAEALLDYLDRHPEMESRLSKGASQRFRTTGDPEEFEGAALKFFGKKIQVEKVRWT